jgi:hypothetical protein
MRYPVRVLVLALAAVVVITVCQRQQSGRQLQHTGVHQESEEDQTPALSRKVEPDNEPRGNPGPRGDEQPPADAAAHVAEEPAAGSEPEVSDGLQADPGSQGARPDEEPLLLLDDEPAVLLDGTQEGIFAPSGPVADNSRCHHCHLDYVDEDLAVVHAEANIGCADCHGNCDAHIADESWASGGNGTPPEIMYPREKVNPCCLDCHPEDELGKLEHESFLAGTAAEKYCTDCHGDHRLPVRKCKWK